MKKILKGTAAALLVLMGLGTAVMVIQKRIAEDETERLTAIGREGISFQEEVTLGGVRQWIFVRGENPENPVILYIHGGPGSPHSFMAHAFDRGIEKEFIVVNWDQRGAGKSFSPFTPGETLTKEQYLKDTYELVQWLKRRFSVSKIYIMGHSWGSWLGAVTAHRHPEDFIAFIGIGQMVNTVENERVSYQFTLEAARRDGNEAAIAELEEIGEPPYKEFRDMGTQRTWLQHYGGGMFYGEHRNDAFRYMGELMFASPYYNFLDMFRFFIGIVRSLFTIWPKYFTLDLYTQAPNIDVPVYFMAGRHDYNTPWPIVEKYMKVLKAPSKKIIWFENSAHAPNFEEPEAFAEAMRRIKKETWSAGDPPRG